MGHRRRPGRARCWPPSSGSGPTRAVSRSPTTCSRTTAGGGSRPRTPQVWCPNHRPRRLPRALCSGRRSRPWSRPGCTGFRRGLVVMATGLGKTWLAAFDTARPQFRRVLFVAHREEILRQSLDVFRRVQPDADLGLYYGGEKQPDARVLFASVQTLAAEPAPVRARPVRLRGRRRVPSRCRPQLPPGDRPLSAGLPARTDRDPQPHGRRRPARAVLGQPGLRVPADRGHRAR